MEYSRTTFFGAVVLMRYTIGSPPFQRGFGLWEILVELKGRLKRATNRPLQLPCPTSDEFMERPRTGDDALRKATRLSPKALTGAAIGFVVGAMIPVGFCVITGQLGLIAPVERVITLAFVPVGIVLGTAIGAIVGALRHPHPAPTDDPSAQQAQEIAARACLEANPEEKVAD